MAEDKPSLAEQILSQFGSRSFLEQARMGARYFVGKNKWRAVDWVRMCYREAVTTHEPEQAEIIKREFPTHTQGL
jgi:hypothetical protein